MALTQENKLISVSVEGQKENDLLLQTVMGMESISRPFLFQLDVLSPLTDLDFSTLLGRRACVILQTIQTHAPRYFNGFISRFVQVDSVSGLNHYRVDVVPWIWFLGLEVDCRIFHNMRIPEIVAKVLKDFPGAQKDSFQNEFKVEDYPKLEYCVQYRESSLAFISRLMEHAGIFYYFTHTNSSHVLHMCDDNSQCRKVPKPVDLLPEGAGIAARDALPIISAAWTSSSSTSWAICPSPRPAATCCSI